MSMYDTGSIDLILPSGKKFQLGIHDQYELQVSIACLGMHFHITNLGTQGYSKNDTFNPFSTFKNKTMQFSIGDGMTISPSDIKVYFNKFGVVYKIAFTKWNNELKKWIDDPETTVEWPEDQIKKYNRQAIIEMIKLQPSRFKEGVSTWTRIRAAFHFNIYLKIARLSSRVKK